VKLGQPATLLPQIGEDARRLMEEIQSCEEAARVLGGSFAETILHPCRKVVSAQFEQGDITSVDQWHAPEPWTGDIERAKVLFVSSNPSFHHDDTYPGFPAHDGLPVSPVHFFHSRFHDARFTDANGLRARHRDGSWHSVGFWKDLQKVAQQLLGESEGRLNGGRVAFTEIVHCKSKREAGVEEAKAFCTQKYLAKILDLAGNCRIVIALGDKAREALLSADPRLQLNYKVYPGEGGGRCYATTCHPSYLRRPAAPREVHAKLCNRGDELPKHPTSLSETWMPDDFRELLRALDSSV